MVLMWDESTRGVVCFSLALLCCTVNAQREYTKRQCAHILMAQAGQIFQEQYSSHSEIICRLCGFGRCTISPKHVSNVFIYLADFLQETIEQSVFLSDEYDV